ncbi:hypothetical protein GF357_03720 [Candidatus Dojkabacteria bacterium]|nr:hypothetical protein [Candidatus Dojkabacteria bacterium]
MFDKDYPHPTRMRVVEPIDTDHEKIQADFTVVTALGYDVQHPNGKRFGLFVRFVKREDQTLVSFEWRAIDNQNFAISSISEISVNRKNSP